MRVIQLSTHAQDMYKNDKLCWTLAALMLLFLYTFSSASISQVYKYEDEQGNVIYTDTPPADEQNMAPAELPDIIVQPGLEVPDRDTISDSEKTEPIEVSIITPKHETTINHDETAVTVFAKVTRPVQRGEQAYLLINGTDHSSSRRLNWSITNLERGEMQLVVQIRDNNGDVLASSESIAVFVKRPSVNLSPAPRAN